MTFPALSVTWELDGFQFNVGTDAQGHSTVIDVAEWDDGAGPKPRFSERSEGDGAYFAPNYRAGKAMRIKGVAQAMSPGSRENLRDRLAGLCMQPNVLYPLTCRNPFRSSGDLTMWVSLYDTPAIRRQMDGVSLTIDIPVFAPTPWKYSAPNPDSVTQQASPGLDGILWNGSPSASGGIEYNGSPTVSGGLIYESGAGSSGLLRLTNSGNKEAPIKFTITSESLNPLLVAVQTQQRMRWSGLITGPNYLTIDTDTENVTLGSSENFRTSVVLAEANFFKVPANGFLDVEYRHDLVSSSQAIASNSNVYG